MLKRLRYSLVVAFVGFYSWMDATVPADRQISADALLSAMQSHTTTSNLGHIDGAELVVIDVLDASYHSRVRIKPSVNIPLKKLIALQENPDKDLKLKDLVDTLANKKMVVVYCASPSCTASADAFNILAGMGVKNIYAFEGGVQEWAMKDYPLKGSFVERARQNVRQGRSAFDEGRAPKKQSKGKKDKKDKKDKSAHVKKDKSVKQRTCGTKSSCDKKSCAESCRVRTCGSGSASCHVKKDKHKAHASAQGSSKKKDKKHKKSDDKKSSKKLVSATGGTSASSTCDSKKKCDKNRDKVKNKDKKKKEKKKDTSHKKEKVEKKDKQRTEKVHAQKSHDKSHNVKKDSKKKEHKKEKKADKKSHKKSNVVSDKKDKKDRKKSKAPSTSISQDDEDRIIEFYNLTEPAPVKDVSVEQSVGERHEDVLIHEDVSAQSATDHQSEERVVHEAEGAPAAQ